MQTETKLVGKPRGPKFLYSVVIRIGRDNRSNDLEISLPLSLTAISIRDGIAEAISSNE